MSEPNVIPFTILGRSPFDPIRLRWSGVGNTLLGVALIFSGSGSAAAIIFGLLFLALAIATWSITNLGRKPWYALSPGGKAVAGTGSIVGLIFLYLCFFWIFLTLWFLKLIARNL